MSLNRLLRYLNLLVGVVLAVALFATYWIVYRPLPKVSGSIDAPLNRTVTVVRDKLGVPHISAESLDDGRDRFRSGMDEPSSESVAVGQGGIPRQIDTSCGGGRSTSNAPRCAIPI